MIRSASNPYCALCGSDGGFIHRQLKDQLFGADGSWNLKKCSNPLCRLVWLDPMPLPEDIGKAYQTYYTHSASAPQETERAGTIKRVFRFLKQAYLADQFGYANRPGAAPRIFGKLFYLLPPRRLRANMEIRHLKFVPHGRLLDVGCGSGSWLGHMRSLGWQVEGLDFDAQAVNAAIGRGLAVRLGGLEEQAFAANSFDVVTMSHVIEHVPNPVITLKECARILKPGGKLVLWTPNISSLGHRIFKQHWRGLEPPRHLHLFCPSSMQSLLRLGGFTDASIRTRTAPLTLQKSLALKAGRLAEGPGSDISAFDKFAASALTLAEGALLVTGRKAGEWLDVHAVKP